MIKSINIVTQSFNPFSILNQYLHSPDKMALIIRFFIDLSLSLPRK